MSRKKSTRNKAISPILTKPKAKPKPKPKRKGPHFLTLIVMGGAALFILKGCDDEDSSTSNFYSTPYECSEDSHPFDVCNNAFDEAKTTFYNSAPKNLSRTACEQQFSTDSCHYERDSNGFIPAFAGFMLGQALANGRQNSCQYDANYCRQYSSTPVWGGSGGYYSYSSNTGKSYSSDAKPTRISKVTTVSRGGYGKSSSARGSWGG